MVRGRTCHHTSEEKTGTKSSFALGLFCFPLINVFEIGEQSYANLQKLSILSMCYDGQLISKLKEMILGPVARMT